MSPTATSQGPSLVWARPGRPLTREDLRHNARIYAILEQETMVLCTIHGALAISRQAEHEQAMRQGRSEYGPIQETFAFQPGASRS
jgi:hypothetical protein